MVKSANQPLGQDPALLLKQEGEPMFKLQLSTRECDGHIVVALRGEPDLPDTAVAAAALAAVATGEPEIIVDLAHLEFIDCSGMNALLRVLNQARHAGGDPLLAAPRQQALRVLTLTGLISVFSVHASAEETAGSAERSRRAAVPVLAVPVL
jgi:anti-sigma B factor antagonist